MTLYYNHCKFIDKSQKINYISLFLSRKIDNTNQNNNLKSYFLQENCLTIFLKIKQINIHIEKFGFGNKSNNKKNKMTFFITKNSNEESSNLNNRSDSLHLNKLNILILFNEQNTRKTTKNIKKEEFKFTEENDLRNNSVQENNEFIKSILVNFILNQ